MTDAPEADLFPAPKQKRLRYLDRSEPNVHWYTECTHPEAAAGRAAINAWYRHVGGGLDRVRSRLHSEVDAEHEQALDELFVGHLLSQMAPDVRYEEQEGASDFRTYDADGRLLGSVEVVSLFEKGEWAREERNNDLLVDLINRRIPPTHGWYLMVDVKEMDRVPAARRLVTQLRSALDQLPPPGPAANALIKPGVGYERLPAMSFVEAGVHIRFHFRPMSVDDPARTRPGAHIVAAGPGIGGMVDSSERLRKRIDKKVGKGYETNGAPLTIAVGIHDPYCNEVQIANALYGQEPGRVDSRPSSLRMRRSVFGAGVQNSRVSSIATIAHLTPWKPDPAVVLLWDNPNPATRWTYPPLTPHARLSFDAQGDGMWAGEAIDDL